MRTLANTIGIHPWPTASMARRQHVSCPSQTIRETYETDLVKIVVLADQLLQLRLDVVDAFRRKFKLDQRHSGVFEVFEESDLRRLQEQ